MKYALITGASNGIDERRMAKLGCSSPESVAHIGGSVSMTLTGKISAWVVSRDLG